jgi:hypothetical protein
MPELASEMRVLSPAKLGIRQQLRESSPWWPLLIWLGVPATLLNLSIACWQVWHLHLVINSTFGGGATSFWTDAVQYGGILAMLLLLVQLALASLLFVAGPGKFWTRLAVYSAVISWIAGCIFASAVLSIWFMHWLERVNSQSWIMHDAYSNLTAYDAVRAASSLPMLLLGMQLPLWFVRILAGWRLTQSATTLSEDDDVTSNSLSIRDLLVATAVVATSLSLLQFAERLDMKQTDESIYHIVVLCGSAVCGTAMLLGGIPLAALFLRRIQLRIAWAVTLIAALSCALILALILRAAGATGDVVSLLIACAGLFPLFASYALGLSLLRGYGWRLERRATRLAKASEST